MGSSGTLHLVASPIGNLQDLTLRALRVLEEVDLVLAEDTRRTRKLLAHFEIDARLMALHEHNEEDRAAGLVERLSAGESMALVADAGTPLISDPGYTLVRRAIEAGVEVVPVPGASAVLAALVGSGLPPDRFTFLGYLPPRRAARRRRIRELAGERGTLVLLESPRRLPEMLADAAEILGPRPAAVARELTKVHEEFLRGPLDRLAADLERIEVRGEVTVCIGALDEEPAVDPPPTDELAAEVEALLDEGTARNEALRAVADRHGLSRNDLYRLVVLDDDREDDGPGPADADAPGDATR